MALSDFQPDYRDAELSRLRSRVERLERLLLETPILLIDVKAAHLNSEDAVLKYAKQLAEWQPRARAALQEKGE